MMVLVIGLLSVSIWIWLFRMILLSLVVFRLMVILLLVVGARLLVIENGWGGCNRGLGCALLFVIILI